MAEDLLIDPEVASLEGRLESFLGTVAMRATRVHGTISKRDVESREHFFLIHVRLSCVCRLGKPKSRTSDVAGE